MMRIQPTSNTANKNMKEYNYADITAATAGFAVDHLIGKGSHGSVYRATLKTGHLVAVKKPASNTSTLDAEIAVLTSLQTSGATVVALLGVTRSPAPSPATLMIMDLMPHGSLHDLLHSGQQPPPSFRRRAAIALDVARAVAALHAASVIHRDIKSANILFNRRRRARLADFSLAVSPAAAAPPPAAGTIGYLDPNYTSPEKLGTANDVYSFGVVLLELVSGRRAIDVEREPASVVSWAAPAIRRRQAEEVCDRRVALTEGAAGAVCRILNVAERCVSRREERRPTMGEVVGELALAVEEMGGSLSRRVYRCVRAWRRQVANRVTTTKIVCTDHLIGNNDDDDDDDDM